MKLSNYVFLGNTLIANKYLLVYSSMSNKLLALDKLLIEKIKQGDFYTIDDNILEELARAEIIVDGSTDELSKIIEINKQTIKEDNLLYQSIQPSANCQLGCDYCGQVHHKGSLDVKMEDRIFDRIAHNLEKKDYRYLEVSWFGGEPLMGLSSIKTLSKRFIDLCKLKDVEYAAKMVTNGLSLKKEIYYELVEKFIVKNFEITIDGTAEFHDKRRYTKSNENTFDIIINNLESIVNDPRFIASKSKINIRSNVDSSNHSSIKDLIDILDQKNILRNVKFYMAPIHSWGNDAHQKSLSQNEFAEFELDIYLYLIEKGIKAQLIPGRQKNITCLSLYDNGELFDSNGNVYNCSEISQVPLYEENNFKFRVGNYIQNTNAEIDSVFRPFSDWNDDILKGRVPCYDCKLLPICGGACPKLWKEDISPCPSMKFNFEDRMFLQFYQDNLNEHGEFDISHNNKIDDKQDVHKLMPS